MYSGKIIEPPIRGLFCGEVLMKKLYGNIVTGAFVMRMNRFVIHAEIDGKMEICHMPNPGRMRELLFPGVKMYFVKQLQNISL